MRDRLTNISRGSLPRDGYGVLYYVYGPMLVRVAFLEKRLAKFEHLVNALYCSYYWYCKGVYLVVPLISSEFGLICHRSDFDLNPKSCSM